MLAHIHASARSLQKCITSTYAELADVPVYFETYKGSITDYKNRNNLIPFMPLSHVSFLLNNSNRIVNNATWKNLRSNTLNRYGGAAHDDALAAAHAAADAATTAAAAARASYDDAVAPVDDARAAAQAAADHLDTADDRAHAADAADAADTVARTASID